MSITCMYGREMIASQKVKKKTKKKPWRIGSQNQNITEDISPKKDIQMASKTWNHIKYSMLLVTCKLKH